MEGVPVCNQLNMTQFYYTRLALQKCIRLNTKLYKEHLKEEWQGTERILAKWNINPFNTYTIQNIARYAID